jgi:aromatic-L-amino-acid/L-tryptophan decarboxylase
LAAGEPWPCEFGPDLSRGFRALKVWFTLQEHGLDRLGQQVAQNVAQAQWLAAEVDAQPDLERLGPAPLNIVCFRHRPAGLPAQHLDAHNDEIVLQLHEAGIAAPSTTRIGGALAIRVCLTNHRTRTSDLALLLSAVTSIGEDLHARTR